MTTRKKVSKNEKHIKTKKKARKDKKRMNQTAHQRAMTNPTVRDTILGLRNCWSLLTQRQRGDQLNELIGFGCSKNGLADELKHSASNIGRCIKEANRPEEDEDWTPTTERNRAEEPKGQITISAGEAARHLPSKIPAKKIVGPVANETCAAQVHVPTSTAQQTKKIASPLSVNVKKAPVVNGTMSRQEDQVGEDTSKASLQVAYMSREQFIFEKRQRMEAMVDQIKSRPIFDARSMPRQGNPVPPEDPHKPVS